MKHEEVFLPGALYSRGYNREQALQSVGTGWAELINVIFDKLHTYESTIRVFQVKEKYGGLRVYCDPYVEDFDKFLIEIEKQSFMVCELCGNPGNLRDGKWYRTLCDTHAEGRKSIKPF